MTIHSEVYISRCSSTLYCTVSLADLFRHPYFPLGTVVIVRHFVQAPFFPLRELHSRKKFCSNVAVGLEPLLTLHLHMCFGLNWFTIFQAILVECMSLLKTCNVKTGITISKSSDTKAVVIRIADEQELWSHLYDRKGI